MHPKDIPIADYHYDLPPGHIAHYPLAERDGSKLLVYRNGGISEDFYRHIGDHLPARSLLVFNDTRVIEARIVFRKDTGAQIEIFCLEPPPEYGSIAIAMAHTGKVRWKCLIGGASKWKAGQVLSKAIAPTAPGNVPIVIEARYISRLEDSYLLELSWLPAGLSFGEVLHEAGLIPLPPYIRRAAEPSDSQRYQTIYARDAGSVAAPTAGLHFTEAIFHSLAARHIQQAFVTLHVGAATFLPVKAATMEQHAMHIEFISVTIEMIRELLSAVRAEEGRTIIPVGTTSARTIESLYWLGRKAIRDPRISAEDLVVRQWDAYEDLASNEEPSSVEPAQALQALLDWMERLALSQLVTTTQLLITPGYDWKIAGALITNFHQPESTLLLLVASLIGKDWKRVYDYALEHQFRFLSYGDGCLLYPGAR